MRNLLNAIALLILAGSGYFLYAKFTSNHAIRIVESIPHALGATDEFVFSRDRMKFSERQNTQPA